MDIISTLNWAKKSNLKDIVYGKVEMKHKCKAVYSYSIGEDEKVKKSGRKLQPDLRYDDATLSVLTSLRYPFLNKQCHKADLRTESKTMKIAGNNGHRSLESKM